MKRGVRGIGRGMEERHDHQLGGMREEGAERGKEIREGETQKQDRSGPEGGWELVLVGELLRDQLEVYVEINCLCCIQGRLVVAGGDLGDLWVWDLTAEGRKREEEGERRPREGEGGNEEGEGEGKVV
jgi:hypothetical protein